MSSLFIQGLLFGKTETFLEVTTLSTHKEMYDEMATTCLLTSLEDARMLSQAAASNHL